jgi:hypothetical protein
MLFCLESGVSKIYVTLDGPRISSDKIDTDACKHVLENFNKSHPGILRAKISGINQGAAHSVLGGLDWIFENEDFAVIIEDDCLPGIDFFNYVRDAKIILDRDKKVFLIGGNQFVPSEITDERWFLSDYPLIWGWATSREKWIVLRRELRQSESRVSKTLKSNELIFWEAGARRAIQGYVDAWDTPLVHVLRLNGWQTVLPGRNLVRNIGNDFAATHTLTGSRWLGVEAQPYIASDAAPEVNSLANDWLKSNLYGISLRHQFTTRVTQLLDFVSLNRRKRLPLLERWL